MNDFERSSERDLGAAVMLLRAIRGWTREDLARAAGLPESLIAKIESGKKTPGLKTLERLLVALGVSINSLYRTQTLIETVRAERLGTDFGSPEGSPESTRFDGAGDPLVRIVSPAELKWEVHRLAGEACRALWRLTEVVVVLINRVAQEERSGDETSG